MIKSYLKDGHEITEDQFLDLGLLSRGMPPLYIEKGIDDAYQELWRKANLDGAKFRFVAKTGTYVLDKTNGCAIKFAKIKDEFEADNILFLDIVEAFYEYRRELYIYFEKTGVEKKLKKYKKNDKTCALL